LRGAASFEKSPETTAPSVSAQVPNGASCSKAEVRNAVRRDAPHRFTGHIDQLSAHGLVDAARAAAEQIVDSRDAAGSHQWLQVLDPTFKVRGKSRWPICPRAFAPQYPADPETGDHV
jgi:hypothetical protein